MKQLKCDALMNINQSFIMFLSNFFKICISIVTQSGKVFELNEIRRCNEIMRDNQKQRNDFGSVTMKPLVDNA